MVAYCMLIHAKAAVVQQDITCTQQSCSPAGFDITCTQQSHSLAGFDICTCEFKYLQAGLEVLMTC